MADSTAQIEATLQRAQQLNFKLTIPLHASSDAPLVVLLGWVGCVDRFLAKYSDFLNESGYPTIRAICPTPRVFSPLATPRRRWTADLLRFVVVVDPAGARSLVLYSFSNGGGFVVEQLRELLAKGAEFGHLRPRVQGTLFDSAPAFMFLRAGAQALGEGHPPLVKLLLAVVFYLGVLLTLPIDPRRQYNYWDAMTDLHMPGPTLYLYSDDDPLANAARLEALIAKRREGGADVRERRWAVSQHVGHLRCHTEQYKAAVLEFLQALPTK